FLPSNPPPAASTTDRSNALSTPAGVRVPFDERLLAAQVALGRFGISPGSLDGVMGAQTRAALRAFQKKENLPATGALDEPTQAKLLLDGPLYTNYVVTAEDLASLQPL